MNDDEIAQAITLTTEQIMAAKNDLEIGERLVYLHGLVAGVAARSLPWPVIRAAIACRLSLEEAMLAQVASRLEATPEIVEKVGKALGYSMGLGAAMQQNLGDSGGGPKQ